VHGPIPIEHLAPFASRYDALLCDAWGVIHDGVRVFDGAAEALLKFSRERGPVLVITNAPRPSHMIPPQLDRLGLPRAAYSAVVTSGDATRVEIAKRQGKAAFRIGPAKDDALFEGVPVEFADLDKASFIICTGLIDDQSEEPDDYRGLLKKAADRRLEMICANPDVVVRWGGRLAWCAGSLARIYEEFGGTVVYGGKPHAPIYSLAMEEIAELRGAPANRSRILAIGDGAATDIRGANLQGIDAVYVAGPGGVHHGASSADAVAAALKAAGASAIAVMEHLQW